MVRPSLSLGIAMLLAAILSSPACARESDGGTQRGMQQEEAYADALVDSWRSHETTLDTDELQCLARSLVRAIGVNTMRGHVTVEEVRDVPAFSPSRLGIEASGRLASVLYGEAGACMDVRQVLVDAMLDGESVTERQRMCIEKRFDDDIAKTFLATILFEGTDELVDRSGDLRRSLSSIGNACTPRAGDVSGAARSVAEPRGG